MPGGIQTRNLQRLQPRDALGHRGGRPLQGRGLDRWVVEELPHSPAVAGMKRVDLMTINSAGFYRQLGFRDADPQQLLVLKR